MTTQEFSDTFDTLLNSYGTQPQFGNASSAYNIVLDEYEKSLFLSQAQEELVLSLYTGRNVSGKSFEGTEEERRNLSNIVKEAKLYPITTTNGSPLGMGSKSKFFTLPEDLWFITYESVTLSKGKCSENAVMQVYPVKQDEYQVIKNNPFRGANDRRALRLDLSEGNVEVICKYTVKDYYIRYVKKLKPIILENLSDGLSIDNETQRTECELNPALHRRILDRAVMLAITSKTYNSSRENRNS